MSFDRFAGIRGGSSTESQADSSCDTALSSSSKLDAFSQTTRLLKDLLEQVERLENEQKEIRVAHRPASYNYTALVPQVKMNAAMEVIVKNDPELTWDLGLPPYHERNVSFTAKLTSYLTG